MNLPISTQKTLDLSGVHYTIYNLEDTEDQKAQPLPPAEMTVMLIILSDCIGKMQCIFTKDRFLDLSQTCERTGRNLQALTKDQKYNILHTFGMDSSTSIPDTTQLPTIVDKRLIEKESLYFYTGEENTLIHIKGKSNIQQLFSQSNILDISKAQLEYMPDFSLHNLQDETSLRKAVENFTTRRIKQRLDSTLEIPPMPSTGQKIVRLRVDPDASVVELSKLVETDPSLSAQVVSWASSPYYAAPGKIRSVQDAVMRVLGFDLVINLALGLSLGKSLELPKDNPHSGLTYWKQAVYAAAIGELIAKKAPPSLQLEPGLAYLSGLLHNFGYLILGHVFPPHLVLINRYIEANPHVPQDILENFTLGITSQQIAAWLMNLWSMPEEVTTAIRWQKNPHYSGDHSAYASVLNITHEIINHRMADGQSKLLISQKLLDQLEFTQETIQNIVEKIWENLDHLDLIAKNLEK